MLFMNRYDVKKILLSSNNSRTMRINNMIMIGMNQLTFDLLYLLINSLQCGGKGAVPRLCLTIHSFIKKTCSGFKVVIIELTHIPPLSLRLGCLLLNMFMS